VSKSAGSQPVFWIDSVEPIIVFWEDTSVFYFNHCASLGSQELCILDTNGYIRHFRVRDTGARAVVIKSLGVALLRVAEKAAAGAGPEDCRRHPLTNIKFD
jgi:hypothetical protein